MVSAEQATSPEQIFIPPAWMEHVVGLEEKYCEQIRKADPRAVVNDLAACYRDGYTLIEPYLKNYTQPKVLEIGAGYGFSLCYLRKRGLDAVGIEPGDSPGYEGRYNQAIELLEANGIENARQILHPAFGEELPFPDKSFDIVYSSAVLEHVSDIERCLNEAIRVTKPGGTLVMDVPSYNSYREGHYNILWLPHLLKSKRIARWYVRTLFKRQDWFINELNFTTPAYFRRLAKKMDALRGMKVYLVIDPFFGPLLGRMAQTHYFMKESFEGDRRLKHKMLLGATGLALKVGEFCGMSLGCRLVLKPHGD